MEQAALLWCTAGLPSALAVAGEGEHALLESLLSPIGLAWAPSGHLSVNQFRKLCSGSPVCFLSLAPDCSIPSVLTSLPWWQEAEQLGVSPLSSTSVTPAPGWLQFWTATSSQRCCMALLLLLFFLTIPTLLGCQCSQLALSGYGKETASLELKVFLPGTAPLSICLEP